MCQARLVMLWAFTLYSSTFSFIIVSTFKGPCYLSRIILYCYNVRSFLCRFVCLESRQTSFTDLRFWLAVQWNLTTDFVGGQMTYSKHNVHCSSHIVHIAHFPLLDNKRIRCRSTVVIFKSIYMQTLTQLSTDTNLAILAVKYLGVGSLDSAYCD